MIERRDFLRAGALAALGVAAACANKPEVTAKPGTLDAIQGKRTQDLGMSWSRVEVLAGRDERFSFTLTQSGANQPAPGASGQLWLAKDRAQSEALGPFPIRPLGDGFEAVGLYLSTVEVPEGGQWLALADVRVPGSTGQIGATTVLFGSDNDQIKPGARAVKVATPTASNHRGVEPYCTLKPKPCSMHGISLDAALANDKPTVVIIATPAYCESRLCGPEVELLQHVSREIGDDVNFVHIEVYKDDAPDTIRRRILAPAAKAWKLATEPATYWIDAGGRVVDRALGPLDGREFRDATRALVS